MTENTDSPPGTDATGNRSTELSTGTRLRCTQCGSEAIITAAGTEKLECCATPMEVIFSRPA